MRKKQFIFFSLIAVLSIIVALIIILRFNGGLSFIGQNSGISNVEEIAATKAVEAVGEIGEIDQRILFEYSYSNSAWCFNIRDLLLIIREM